MATWEDGPEYAPVERPADFAPSAAPPLTDAPPVEPPEEPPTPRPVFHEPPVPVAPLATLVPPVADRRDPHTAFDVVATALTPDTPRGDSAWGAVHWGQSSQPAATPAASLVVQAGPPPAPPGGFPAPGTPQWFAPPPYGQQPVAPGALGAREVLAAATPGLCICLLVGGLVPVVAPIMLSVCFGLSARVSVARPAVRRAFLVAVSTLAVIAVLVAVVNLDGFGAWWTVVGRWAMAFCWMLLVVVLVLVHRGLRAARQPPPAPWC